MLPSAPSTMIVPGKPPKGAIFFALLMALCSDAVQACGGLFCTLSQPVVQAAESIAFGLKDRRVEMHVQIQYQGPSEKFSWVLPMPILPEVSVGSDILFSSLFDRTRPVFELTIEDGDDRSTCSNDEVMCPVSAEMDMAGDGASPSATKLDEGTVGPFDYVIIEAADGHPGSVRRWLDENGYDQPKETEALLNYYASMQQKFVALRLKKDTSTGEIRPIVLGYDLPESADVMKMPFACVPIQLTAIAATNDMPIQVYLLADARGFPVNYFDVQLDDSLADWVGCLGSPNCYLNDLRARFASVASTVSNHSFVTEYAGPSTIMKEAIELPIDLSDLKSSGTPLEFLNKLDMAGVPANSLVHSIVEKWIPKSFSGTNCNDLTNVYIPSSWMMANCVPTIKTPEGWTFNATGLATELNAKVLEPAVNAQAWVDSHPILSRLFAQLSPNEMNKDPFFAFNPDLTHVDRVHRATAMPVCSGEAFDALKITVEGGNTTTVPATRGCSGWTRTSSELLFGVNGAPSAAVHVTAHGYQGEDGIQIERQRGGSFLPSVIDASIQVMDDRVVDQTVPQYTYDNGTETVPVTEGPDPDIYPEDEANTIARSSAVSGVFVHVSLLWLLGSAVSVVPLV